MVIGYINWSQGNRIMTSFFNHFAYWKLHTDDKKCLVYRGGWKEGQFIRFYYHSQSRLGIMIVCQQGNRIAKTDTSLSAWTVIKDRYRAEPWIVLHGWPIEPMDRWIGWVTSSWNIGRDWSPIADCSDCPTIGPNHECWRCIGQALPLNHHVPWAWAGHEQ